IIDVDFIAAPTEIVPKVASQSAVSGNVGCQRSYGDVVSVLRYERSVVTGVTPIEKSVTVKIVAARRFALVIEPSQQGKILRHSIHVVRASTGYGTELTLPDQAQIA